MNLALWQRTTPAADIYFACARAEAARVAAAALGAAVVVLPEIWLPGYNQPDIPARSLTIGSPPMRRLSPAAAVVPRDLARLSTQSADFRQI